MTEEVTLENDDGETKTVKVSSAGKVTCPECGAKGPDQVDIHTLNRVLAGECAVCFHVWSIGVDSAWEVKDT